MCIGVYKDNDNFVTSGVTLLSDLDLQETYRSIDSVATGRIPSLFRVVRVQISIYADILCRHILKRPTISYSATIFGRIF